MGNFCAFWPQQTVGNSARFSCPTHQVGPCQTLPCSTVQVVRTRDFHLLCGYGPVLFPWQKAQGHKRSQEWGAHRHLSSVETRWWSRFLESHLFQRPSSWLPSSLKNSPVQLRGVYPKAGHYWCLLLARTFPSLPLNVERRSSPFLTDASSLESQMQVRNRT